MNKRKRFFGLLAVLMLALLSVGLVSCSDDDDDGGGGSAGNAEIVGIWVDGKKTMVLGSDGSYNMTDTSMGDKTQYRKGTYSYNPVQGLFALDVPAVPGQNSAYRQTYIVQTLTQTTLVLLYKDGDIEGYYTRRVPAHRAASSG